MIIRHFYSEFMVCEIVVVRTETNSIPSLPAIFPATTKNLGTTSWPASTLVSRARLPLIPTAWTRPLPSATSKT